MLYSSVHNLFALIGRKAPFTYSLYCYIYIESPFLQSKGHWCPSGFPRGLWVGGFCLRCGWCWFSFILFRIFINGRQKL